MVGCLPDYEITVVGKEPLCFGAKPNFLVDGLVIPISVALKLHRSMKINCIAGSLSTKTLY